MANKVNKLRALIAVLYALLAATALDAQQAEPPRIHPVQIELVNSCGTKPRPETLMVVINGESHSIDLTGEVWRKVWPDRLTFPVHASVRWETKNGWMRSECRTVNSGSGTLIFKFQNCNSAETYKITTDPTKVLSSFVLRDLQIGDGPCREAAPLEGQQTLVAVLFKVEDLWLQFGSRQPVYGTGLRVNDVVERAKKTRQFDYPLTVDGIVHQLSIQRARSHSAQSHTAPNAIDLDIKKLAFTGLENIVIEVR